MRAYNKEICPILEEGITKGFPEEVLRGLKSSEGLQTEGRALERTFLEKGTASSKAPRQERNGVFLLVEFIVRKSAFHVQIWGSPTGEIPQNKIRTVYSHLYLN